MLIPLEDTHRGSTQAAYEHANQLFLHGYVARSQQEANEGFRRFQIAEPAWAAKFQILEAKSMLYRGLYRDVLRVLASYPSDSSNPEGAIQKLAIESGALTRLRQFSVSDRRLSESEELCKMADYPVCGDVIRARGALAASQGQVAVAQRYYFDSLTFARAHHDRWSEASASLNLGWIALQSDHFDEAVDNSKLAYGTAMELGAENQAMVASGNLGWAYYQLGDAERALALFRDAEKRAARNGDFRSDVMWLGDIGYVLQNEGNGVRAIEPYREALELAQQIDSKQDIVICLEELAHAALDVGKLDEASAYIAQAFSLERANGNPPSGLLMLAQGKLAAARHDDRLAEDLLRSAETDPSHHTTTRLSAGLELAKLYERQGRSQDAESQYKTALAAFELARATLKHEDSKLPFMANAMPLYDGYIQLLVQQGRVDEALEAADRSRARTLAQGLGLVTAKTALQPVALHPAQIAQKTGATLLFYWLGERQSYLWAITHQKTALYPLPARAEIAARVERYRKALLAMQNPLELDSQEQSTQDGRALYDLLVAPAARLLRRNAPVTILADGALSQLNFETLLAPGPGAGLSARSGNHYWIDDATLLSAPSLSMLAAAKPDGKARGKMLLMGNAVSPNPDYPELTMAPMEMKLIQKHFVANGQTVFAGVAANPGAYLRSNPGQFSYIHFVTHGTASSAAPLDSAIILSRPTAADDGFKLYARDILLHPIDARLVTISACYGSGTRAYAGEGLVGLSWAFLRAGAHNVIGALWEVSDESTPRLMDSLYQGLEAGQTPSAALRRSKLALLHSSGSYRAPFFWAPFQIYTGH